VANFFISVILPSFLALGISLNIIVLCIWMFGPKSKSLCCATYFASNAVSDLLCSLVPGISIYTYLVFYSSEVFMDIYIYTSHLLFAISNWISSAISVERALTVLWPFVFKSQDMKRRSKYVVLAICVLFTAVYVFMNYYNVISDEIGLLISLGVVVPLPFILIVLFNTVVVATLCRNNMQQNTVSSNHSRYVDVFTKITILTGLSFVVSNSLFVYCYIWVWINDSVDLKLLRYLLLWIAPVMQFSNCALNPIIGFAVCKSVREDAKSSVCKIVRMCRCKKQGQVPATAHV